MSMSASPSRGLAAAAQSGRVAVSPDSQEGDDLLSELVQPLQPVDRQQQQQQHTMQQQQPMQQQQQHQRRTRPTQGELVQRSMVVGPPTIDIGANLVDRSFDKARPGAGGWHAGAALAEPPVCQKVAARSLVRAA